jgi:hypothetical protein
MKTGLKAGLAAVLLGAICLPAGLSAEDAPPWAARTPLGAGGVVESPIAHPLPPVASLGGGTREACEHVICLEDAVGNGWNGATVDIYVNSVFLGNVTQLAGEPNPVCFAFDADNGDLIEVTFNGGSADEECFYAVFDGVGALLCSHWGDDTSPNCMATGNCLPCVECPCEAVPEGEPGCGPGYDDTFNAGCNETVPVFWPIQSGDIVCGTSGGWLDETNPSAPFSIRDTDWYLLEITEPTELTWTVSAMFPVQTILLDAGPGCDGVLGDQTLMREEAGVCEVATLATPCLIPGQYWLFVSPQSFGPGAATCGDIYVAELTTAPCTISYCSATSTACDEYISKVEFEDINNAGTPCDNYADYTALSTTLERGGSYPITVINGGPAYTADATTVWIDWNQDQHFANDEATGLPTGDGGTTFSGTIDVPVDAPLGATRLRVRLEWAGFEVAGPCGIADWGEVEDYTVDVIDSTTLALVPEKTCYRVGETARVEIWMRSIAEDISGGQFFLNYDTNFLAVPAGTPAAIVPGDPPMTRQVFECSVAEQTGSCAGGVAGEIGYAVGAATEGDSVTGTHLLATIEFTVLQDICDFADRVTWRTNSPPTRLTTLPFGIVTPPLVASAGADMTSPEIVGFPADMTLTCADLIPAPDVGLVTATDNCSSLITVTHEGDFLTGGSGCPCDPYNVRRIYRAADHCGNYVEDFQVFTIVDDVPPVLTGCPADVTVECDAVPPAGPVSATDNCDPLVELSLLEEITPGICPDTYTLTRTWTATDDCGNEASCVQVVTVQDTTPPLITQPPTPTTVECDGTGIDAQIAAWLAGQGGATATDNCGAVTWTHDYATANFVPECGGTGYVDVVFTATDDCNHSTVAAPARFTIDDTTPPVITCPGNAGPFNATAPGCTYTYTWSPATAIDACEGDLSGSIMYEIDELDDGSVEATINATTYTFPVGISRVTAVVADGCLPPVSCSFLVEVLGYNDLVVTVELEGDIAPPGVTRCVEFEFYTNCATPPVVVDKDLVFMRDGTSGSPTFGFGIAAASFTLADGVPCSVDGYTCVRVQDEYHTLTRQVAPVVASGGYAVECTLANGKHLLQGDYYDDIMLDNTSTDYIDILDFGVWFNEFGAIYSGDTLCTYPDMWHANASGYGESDITNYSFVANNFLAIGETCCTTRETGQPLRSITVEELRRRGLTTLIDLDVNGDRVFDMTDVNLLLEDPIPQPRADRFDARRPGNRLNSRRPPR